MSTDMSVPRPRLPGQDAADPAQLSALLAEAPIGFAFITADGVIRRANAAMAALSVGDARLAGQSVADVWPADLAAAAGAAIRRVAAGDRPAAQTEHVIEVPAVSRQRRCAPFPGLFVVCIAG